MTANATTVPQEAQQNALQAYHKLSVGLVHRLLSSRVCDVQHVPVMEHRHTASECRLQGDIGASHDLLSRLEVLRGKLTQALGYDPFQVRPCSVGQTKGLHWPYLMLLSVRVGVCVLHMQPWCSLCITVWF